jgi:hypothetical protein
MRKYNALPGINAFFARNRRHSKGYVSEHVENVALLSVNYPPYFGQLIPTEALFGQIL